MKTRSLLPLLLVGIAFFSMKFPRTARADPCQYCTNTIVDDLDAGPWPCGDQDQEDGGCDPPSANDGPAGDSNPNDLPCDCGSGGGGPSDSGCGAPVWRVSEPYCTLWLRDVPLLYRRSNGKWMRLELRYKHRGEILTNGIGSFGPKWYCTWLGILENDGSSTYTDHFPGGGQSPLDPFHREYRFSMQLVPPGSGGAVPKTVSPTGAQNQYDFCSSFSSGTCSYFRTRMQDRYSRTTYFNFELTSQNWVRITNVVDTDGLKCVLTYNDQNLVSTVSDPYGRTAHFNYDANGQLTNIVDTMGMSSTFEYGTSNVITRMTTPYGPTSFEYFADTNNVSRRAVRVTEASGDQQLYAYCGADIVGVAAGGDNAYVRNSFHWNRAQYQAVSSTGKASVLDMPASDYLLAETSHWLSGVDDNNYGALPVSDTLNARSPPADANGYRNVEWFQYLDQSTSQIGSLKRVTEHFTPMGQTLEIARNNLGRPTTVTYYNTDGKSATYVNSYDTSGYNLLSVAGPQSELVRGYGYHPTIPNLLVSVTNALGDVTRYTQDGNTNWLRVTNIAFAGGLVRTNFYTNGFLVQSVDLGFRTNLFSYENGNVKTRTDELGLTVTNSFDALNRLTNIAFPDGTSVAYLYDKLDVVGVKDRLGHWTRYQYNSIRQLTTVTNANGQVTEYAYCGCGSPTSVTRWNGTTPVTDTFSYDIAGHLTNATYADGYQLGYTYNANDLVATVTDNTGLSLVLNYIQIGRIYKISTAWFYWDQYAAQVLANSYDGYGRLQASTDRNGITVTNAYDFLDRVVTRVTMDMNSQPYATNTFAYTARGLTNSMDAFSNATWYVLDAAGRLLSQTNANNEVLRFTYNAADQMLSLTDGKAQQTRWNYNQYGQVTDKVDQASAEVQRFVYDPNGRITNRWTAAMGTNSYRFDPIGNLTNITYPGNITVSYAFDGLNRLTNMVDAVGTTKFTYTASGQLLTEQGPFASSAITNVYTCRMRTNLTLQQPAGVWTNAFGYSPLHRLTSVASPAGAFTYYYDEPSDRLTTLSLPYGASIYNASYDSMSRLTDSLFYDQYSNPVDRHSYLYDVLSQRTNETRLDSSTVYYFYDNIGQLKVADSSVAAEDRGYFYDTAWNLNRRTNNGVTSSFPVNVRNQVTNAPSPVGSVIYDLNGNTRTNHGGQWVYSYDGENRLSQFYRNGGISPKETQFVYDGLSRLRRRLEWHFEDNSQSSSSSLSQGASLSGGAQTDGSGTGSWVLDSETDYIYDGFRVIQERDGANNPTVSYTRGNDLSVSLQGAGGTGGLLARSDGYSGGDWTGHAYYYADAGGNITSMLDTNNVVVASYRYDPYGNLISSSGTLAAANVYRFSSKEFHPGSGLYYYGFRFYDPNLQRWVNQDPIGEAGGINLYGFVGNGPINGVDQYGLSWLGDQLSQVGQGIYDTMMGDQPGNYNPDSKGALDAAAGLVDIDRDNNVLRDSMGMAGQLAGDAATEAAKSYAAGKAAAVAGAVVCRTVAGLKNLVGAAETAAAAGTTAAKTGATLPEGSFSIADWNGYPANLSQPTGPFRLLEGAEYDTARAAANQANRAMHQADPALKGLQIHEIQPVKFGGSPTDPLNKIPLTPQQHWPATTWWNQLQRDLEGR